MEYGIHRNVLGSISCGSRKVQHSGTITFFGITVGTDENGIRDVDSVVLGTGTES
jgi:hypothetical protein